MQYTSIELGKVVRETRTSLGLTQENLALAAGTGLRFIIDLEKGKPTCQLQKTLTVLNTLGIQITLSPPLAAVSQDTKQAQGSR
jgi:HTH-type transcriptional regulator/antitoxin HipB